MPGPSFWPRNVVAFHIVLALMTFMLCFGAMTAVGYLLRFTTMSGGSMPPKHVYDSRLGWTARPSYRNDHDFHPPYLLPLSVGINSDGFRDVEWPRPGQREPRGEWILVLGDSFIFGWASFREDTFTYIARELAADNRVEAEFFNGGMTGYGFHHYHRMMELYSNELKPTQVWVMLTENDVGDSALPYDHRYERRVYKPFYDEAGRLTDPIVPQRASLKYADSLLGAWPGIYVIDALQYAVEDVGHYIAGRPTRLTSPRPIRHYDGLIHDDTTRAKFPAIDRVVRKNIEDMIALANAKKIRIRFINNVADRAFDKYFEGYADYYDPGEPIISALGGWLSHIHEEHPGYLWATILAGRVLGINDADGALTRSLARRMTGNLDFSAKRDAARALSGDGWKIGPDDRLVLKGGTPGFLKLFIDRAGRGGVSLSLTIRQSVSPDQIRVSGLSGACQQSSTRPAAERRLEFLCRARLPELPHLGLFRIDTTADVDFESAAIVGAK